MARVTVEDCVEIVPNRFDLVLLAAQRTRQISAGAPLTVQRDHDKNPVVALREIASRTVSTEALQEAVIQDFQKHLHTEESEEDFETFTVQETIYPDSPEQSEELEKMSIIDQDEGAVFQDDVPEEE